MLKISDYLEEDYHQSHKLTLQELERWLWKAAEILRGAVRPERYGSYMLPLLFFKRLSDVYLEEYQDALTKYKDEKAAKLKHVHRFDIPEGYQYQLTPYFFILSYLKYYKAFLITENSTQDYNGFMSREGSTIPKLYTQFIPVYHHKNLYRRCKRRMMRFDLHLTGLGKSVG
jgi:type I restriction-modification system DNA methylase subunit